MPVYKCNLCVQWNCFITFISEAYSGSYLMQNNETRIIFNLADDRWPFGTVGRVPDYRAGRSRDRAPDGTNTKAVKITKENLMPLR